MLFAVNRAKVYRARHTLNTMMYRKTIMWFGNRMKGIFIKYRTLNTDFRMLNFKLGVFQH
jgi:hypothetical protein